MGMLLLGVVQAGVLRLKPDRRVNKVQHRPDRLRVPIKALAAAWS